MWEALLSVGDQGESEAGPSQGEVDQLSHLGGYKRPRAAVSFSSVGARHVPRFQPAACSSRAMRTARPPPECCSPGTLARRLRQFAIPLQPKRRRSRECLLVTRALSATAVAKSRALGRLVFTTGWRGRRRGAPAPCRRRGELHGWRCLRCSPGDVQRRERIARLGRSSNQFGGHEHAIT